MLSRVLPKHQRLIIVYKIVAAKNKMWNVYDGANSAAKTPCPAPALAKDVAIRVAKTTGRLERECSGKVVDIVMLKVGSSLWPDSIAV
jgi:hypothetical protein